MTTQEPPSTVGAGMEVAVAEVGRSVFAVDAAAIAGGDGGQAY